VRVAVLGGELAVRLVAKLLADQGADVVTLEESPEPLASEEEALLRGCRRVAFDHSQQKDLAALVKQSDVLVDCGGDEAGDALGVGQSTLCEALPGLVHCRLPAFASDDPRARFPHAEILVGAAGGCYWSPLPGQVAFTGLPISSSFAAVGAAIGIVAALIARDRDGRGQLVEMPLFDATFLAVGASGVLVDGEPAGARPPDPWSGAHRCADGRWVWLSLATPRFLSRFAAGVGRLDWEQDGYLRRDLETGEREHLAGELRELFASRPAAEWDRLGRTLEVPLTMIRTRAEWLATDHARAAGIAVQTGDGEIGPGPAVALESTPAEVPPAPGEVAAFAWPARDEPGMTMPREMGTPSPPLTGIRVLDFSQVLAGPTAGRMLAELGADVIKINNPHEQGAGYRWNLHRYHTDVNRGKRTLLLDLKHPDGLALAHELAAGADVVIENFRVGVAERLGVGYDRLRARRPDLVYCSVTAFGRGGPWEDAPGYEPNGQSVSGMLARDDGVGKPRLESYSTSDYSTGLLGAYAVLLALFQLRRTGTGQRVEASLARSATFLQSMYLATYPGKAWDEPTPGRRPGWGPLQRLYQADDGWLAVAASPADTEAFLDAVGVAGEAVENGDLEHELERRFAGASVRSWQRALEAQGIAVQPVVSPHALMQDGWVIAHRLSLTRRNAAGEEITTTGPAIRLSRTPLLPGRLVPLPGADAQGVLGELDRAHDLGALVATGAVVLP
jgi:crotonobetainyl-CoA:carnitine CoA-transferase CaiB-like acyl-CoA transferase